MAVFKRSWFVFAGVADEIAFFHPVIEHLVPFDSRRNSCTASPPQTGFFELVNDLRGLQLFDTALPGLIATDLRYPSISQGAPSIC